MLQKDIKHLREKESSPEKEVKFEGGEERETYGDGDKGERERKRKR